MNPEIILSTVSILFAAGLATKLLAQRASSNNHLILVLALFSGTGVLLAMGSIEMAGRYGYSIILALIGFTLIFIFSPLIFLPIRRLSQIIRFATPVDFLTFRYRGKGVATATCISLIMIAIPLILAQLLAINSVVSFLVGQTVYSLPLLAIIVIFLNRHSIQVGVANHLSWIMAAAGLLLIPALGLAAWTSIHSVFGSITQMNDWVVTSGQRFIVQRMDSSYSLLTIFLTASFALPINFSILVSENISDRQASTTAWAYPLLVLLACIPVFPMLWSGIAMQSSSPLQEYLFALPALTQNPVIAGLGAACIILLAVALICSLTLTVSKVTLNSFVLPDKDLAKQQTLGSWINNRQMIIAATLLVTCLLLSLVVKGRSITDFYLVGLSGLAQLTPGMLAVIYIPKANRLGFIVGLTAGMSLWLITLAIPLLFGDWGLFVPWLDEKLYFGMQNWNIWAIEALLLNITLSIIFSVYGKMSDEENYYAAVCMADNIYIPARVEISQKSVGELHKSLRSVLGDAAENEIMRALQATDYNYGEIRPAALRKIRDSINASLNLRYGVLCASRIMQQSIPVKLGINKEPDDIYLIESMLAIHGNRLTGIASELNKLRVHHREILDNLPIGIISTDQTGEVLKWNATIAQYTSISAETATGGFINDLSEPWRSAIGSFVKSGESNIDNLRLELNGQVRWFSLQKSVEQNIEGATDIVLLIEDQTQSVALTQNSIDNERLASVGRLAAGVAHEIGNPVTGIACLAQNLQHETEPDQIAQSAQHILSQTERINLIVQSLIDFSRGDQKAHKPAQPVNLYDAANEAIQLLALSNPAPTVEFVCDIDNQLVILGDYHQLIQVFLNLLSNGRDASPMGGQIIIKAIPEAGQIRVTISDSGTGIKEDIAGRLFEPFVTSKEPGQGTGLGLWVVFNLVQRLGAEVSISSPAENSQCGTTVTLRFPLSSPL